MSETAIVSIGNPIMADDGLGMKALEALREAGVCDRPDVECTHAGTTAFFALEAMSGMDRALLIDALDVPDSEPGDVHRLSFENGQFGDGRAPVHLHDFSFADAIENGRFAYDIPEQMVLFGVTPADLEPGEGLSPRVEAAISELCEAIGRELAGAATQVDGSRTPEQRRTPR